MLSEVRDKIQSAVVLSGRDGVSGTALWNLNVC